MLAFVNIKAQTRFCPPKRVLFKQMLLRGEAILYQGNRKGGNLLKILAVQIKMLHKAELIKVADLYITEKFRRFLFKHTLLRGYVVLYGENSCWISLL